MLEALDSELGRLLSSLPAEQRENTAVIFVGDNGAPDEVVQLPFKKFHVKSSIFEGGVYVPFIVAGAGVTRKGQREAALINTTDLFATIAELAGTGIAQSGDSISLRHLLTNVPGVLRDFIYAEYHDEYYKWRNGWAIRDARYKLIQSGSGQRLFDLIDDPFEKRDLLYPDPSAGARAIADGLAQAAKGIRQE